MTSRPTPQATPTESTAATGTHGANPTSLSHPVHPAITIPSRPQSDLSDVSGVLTSSSPVYSRSHPFLRKFQTTNKQNQSTSPLSAVGAPAFSTSAGGSSPSSSNGRHGNDSTDSIEEATAAVGSAHPTNLKSPTIAAADAADALLYKRLNHLKLDRTVAAIDHAVHSPGCGCSSGDDSDDDARVEPSQFPPVSEEARRFTETLLDQNKAWARKTEEERPGFFAKLEKQQKPQ
ncbi:hypothetical protein BGX28_010254, partial [Mortierella sp. GBA30]